MKNIKSQHDNNVQYNNYITKLIKFVKTCIQILTIVCLEPLHLMRSLNKIKWKKRHSWLELPFHLFLTRQLTRWCPTAAGDCATQSLLTRLLIAWVTRVEAWIILINLSTTVSLVFVDFASQLIFVAIDSLENASHQTFEEIWVAIVTWIQEDYYKLKCLITFFIA